MILTLILHVFTIMNEIQVKLSARKISQFDWTRSKKVWLAVLSSHILSMKCMKTIFVLLIKGCSFLPSTISLVCFQLNCSYFDIWLKWWFKKSLLLCHHLLSKQKVWLMLRSYITGIIVHEQVAFEQGNLIL